MIGMDNPELPASGLPEASDGADHRITSVAVSAGHGTYSAEVVAETNIHSITRPITNLEDHESLVNEPPAAPDKKNYGADLAAMLDPITRERLAKVDPENTQKAYSVAQRTFDAWCTENALDSMPAADTTLTRYVSHLITLGRAPATISQHIGAIRTQHRKNGYRDQPASGLASDLLRWWRRELAKAGQGQKQAIPATPDALRRMVATLDLTTMTGLRDQLALVLGFAGMLRRSEIVGLWAHDVTVTSDGVTLLVRTSKTDKESVGRTVPIPPQADVTVEPVTLTGHWMTQLCDDDGPLLPAVTRRDAVTGNRWWPGAINDLVKRTARDADLPNWERYTGHSLRAGGLTASLRNGIPIGVAARHGGWKPDSPMTARYARVADQWRDNAMKGVL